MTCAACSGRVQRSLEKSPGVRSANVNLMTGAATVEFDPAATSPDRLVETIRGTGYGAELPSIEHTADDLLATQDQARAEEIHDLRRKFAVSMVVAVLTMILSMPLAALTSHGSDDRSADAGDDAAERLPHPRVPGDPRCLGRHLAVAAVGAHPPGGRLGRPSLLRPRLGRLPAPHGRHEHAHRRRHRSRLRLQSSRSRSRTTGSPRVASSPHVYYEAVAWIIALVLLGNLLEARAKGRTSGAIRRLIAPASGHRAPAPGRNGDRSPARAAPAGRRRGGPPGRDHSRRRGRARRHHLRGRGDAHRRADAGGEVAGRHGRRGHPQPERCRPRPDRADRGRYRALADHRVGARRPRAPRRRSSGSPIGSPPCSCPWSSRSRS